MTEDPIEAKREIPRVANPEQSQIDDHLHDCVDDDACPMCGGSGVIEDDCECGDDTCCCLVPTPPECPECGGAG